MSLDRGAARPNRFRTWFESTRARPWIVAHRGDSYHAPENTLDAAARGHAAGADAWEFDVHLARDGVPVVIHDESLLRTTDVARRFPDDPRGRAGYLVSDFDGAEILRLDAGSWFVSADGGARSAAGFGTLDRLDDADRARFSSGSVRVPTLAEALALTAALDWRANVELKTFPDAAPGLLDAVLAVIDATGTADRVLLSSFDHADVARAARLRPEIATGVLAASPLHRPAEYVRDLVGADAYHPSAPVLGADSAAYRRAPSPATLRRDDLDALRARAVPVLVYTVNVGPFALDLAAAGVAGLFTDDPAGLRALLAGG